VKTSPFKRQVGTLTAVAGAVLVLSAQVQAQTQTVTVTGIRSAIESAISLKKNSDNIVEAISAEDIGKLPDSSVAESISRLPGVASQRNKSSGRAQSISVRGMSPDFNAGTLNGREQASNGDSRGVEFDQFPSELLGSVVIYKTPDGGLVNQGLASTIDLRTVRPLDFGKRAAAVNYREQKSGIGSGAGEGKGERVSLSYVDQFADRKLGIALGYTKFADEGAGQQKFNSWGGWAADRDFNGQTVKTPGGFTADTEQTTTNREGLMAVLQWKPNKDFESVLDVFQSEGTFKISKKGLEGAIGGGSAGGYDPQGRLINATIANGVATAGTITDYKGVVRNHDEASADKLDSWGWNNKLKLGTWTAQADLSQSKVTRNNTRYETTAGQPGNANNAPFAGNLGTISWTGFNGSNFEQVKYTTSLDYSSPAVAKLTDPMGWSGGENSPQAGYVALPTTIDEITATRLSGKRDLKFGPLVDVELGMNFSERTKTHTANEGRLVIKDSVTAAGVVTAPYAFKDVPNPGVAIAGTTGLKVISWNPTGSLGTIYDLPPKVDADILNKDWGVKEKVNTAFVKSNIETKILGKEVRGNVGAQLVNASQNGSGWFVNSASCTGNTPATCPSTRVEAGTSYSDFLPSMNLNMDLGGDQVLRMGLAKVVSRPSMADMRGSVTFGVNSTAVGGPRIEGSGGNPYLEPFRANAIDVSYEKYFGNKAYVAVAGFYKDLDTYILKQNTAVDFSRYGVALPPTVQKMGMFTQPVNGKGGSLSGVELTASLPFGMIAKPLDGFGIQVNHSTTESSVNMPANAFNTNDVGVTNIPLPGLSRNVTNIRFYFEKKGFQISLAQRERSRFLGEITDFQDNRQLTFIEAEKTVDAQIGYELQSGPLKGLSILLQGNNLTKTAFKRVNGSTGVVVENIPTGKTYLLGINYKL
jgi:iron complex outermembrane receptor protein